jgi:TPP-dependent trihydroxycyclohexane-1,2-dione (THcHDO) dehydratase
MSNQQRTAAQRREDDYRDAMSAEDLESAMARAMRTMTCPDTCGCRGLARCK